MFKKITAGIISGMLLISSATTTHAEIKTYEGVGEYIMSDFETMDIAKQRAKQYAERNAQEQAGVYVQSFTDVINSQVTEDEIITITNGILNVTEVTYTIIPMIENNVIMFRANIKANIETNDIMKWLERSASERSTLVIQNRELQKAIEDQEKIIAELRGQLNNLQTQQQRDNLAYEYIAADNGFRSNQKVEQAEKCFEQGDYSGAVNLLNEAITLNESNSSAYAIRGSSYGNLQNYQMALRDFNIAIRLGIENSITYYCRGLAYEMLKEYDKSLADFTKAIELDSNYMNAYYNRGLAYLYLNNYNNAIADFNRVIEISPNTSEAYYCRGYCYQAIGNTSMANTDFAKARSLGYVF